MTSESSSCIVFTPLIHFSFFSSLCYRGFLFAFRFISLTCLGETVKISMCLCERLLGCHALTHVCHVCWNVLLTQSHMLCDPEKNCCLLYLSLWACCVIINSAQKPRCCLCKIAMRAVEGSNHKQVIKCASTAFQATVSASYRRTVITSDHLGEKHCRRPDNYVYTY